MSLNLVLVTGVAGFLGRYVARYFSEKGWSVLGIDNSPPENAPLSNLANYHRLQLPDSNLGSILKQTPPQVCIHCAGRASVGLSMTDPSSDFYTNTALTFEILDILRQNAPECKFIFLSSAAVYGNPEVLPVSETQIPSPISPYGFHKWQGEQLCLEFTTVYGLPTASARIFSAYGPGLRRQVIWDICRKIITQEAPTFQGTGQESRDFIHALDIAKALMVIATAAPMQGEVYNLSSGSQMAIAELAQKLLNALEYQKQLKFDGIVPQGTPLNWQADISRLKAIGFVPAIPLEHGLKAFATWCKAELIGV